MDVETRHTIHRVRYGVLLIVLAALSTVLVGVIWVTTNAYGNAPEDSASRELLAYLAWTAVAVLGLTLVVGMLMLMKWLRLRLEGPPKLPEAPYIDAWGEAGKRIEAPPVGDIGQGEDADSDSPSDSEP
jgi:hypothetical protein